MQRWGKGGRNGVKRGWRIERRQQQMKRKKNEERIMEGCGEEKWVGVGEQVGGVVLRMRGKGARECWGLRIK